MNNTIEINPFVPSSLKLTAHGYIKTTSISKRINNQSPQVNLCNLLTDNCQLTTIYFWHLTPAGNHTEINLYYNLPNVDSKNYSLTLLKQNGFPTSPQNLNIFGNSFSTPLLSPFVYTPKQ